MKKTLLALISASLFFACESKPDKNLNSETTTEESNAVAAFELSNLDTTAQACENFYQYAIGGWLKDKPIPSTESRWSSFNVVNEANNEKLKLILEEFASKEGEKKKMEQMLGDFYLSVMDSAKADEMGITPLKPILEKVETLESKSSLIKLIAEQKKLGVNSLFGVYVGQDDKNSEAYIAQLYQSGLGLPDRDYYLKENAKSKELQSAYKLHIEKMMTLAEEENAFNIASKVYEIEKKLAKISMTRVDRRNPENTYNKFSFAKLQSDYPAINWSDFMSAIGIQKMDSLIVGQPDFFKGVDQYLNEIELDDWKIYLKWRILDTYASELSNDFVAQNFDFYGTTLSVTKEMKPRWKRALSKVNGNLGQLLGKAFVKRHFGEEAKADVGQMVENLRAVFKERILQLEWMSEETKEKAIEKLVAFNYKIGYPDKWKDYSNLSIKAGEHVQNIMNARKFNFEYMINKLGKPVDKDEWFMNPQTVNAYYSSSKNEIVFPAGILQPPFYSTEADDAINYGGIGAVIGHEFTHGFDDQGSKYDAKGNLSNWWTDEDRKRFDARAQMVVNQFNGFEPLDSLHVNGKLTLGENIADLGGVTLAYHALEKELSKKGKPEPIDGFTYQQRFFLGWAQVWHMNMTEEELRKRVTTDPHSPGEYRVNGPLANMNEFAQAFDCAKGSTMQNPDSTRAVIW
jgi:putative endopeptidase